jgi:hypothetical protein
MFSSILNNISLEFARKQEVLKQQFEPFEYGKYGFNSICDVEILTSETEKIAVIFHERQDNKGTSVTNAIQNIAPEYLTGADLGRYYDLQPKKLRVFESYRYGNQPAQISEVSFYGNPNWNHCTAEEIVTWLNSKGTSLKDLCKEV